jgi:hypothetical protein
LPLAFGWIGKKIKVKMKKVKDWYNRNERAIVWVTMLTATILFWRWVIISLF